MDSVVHHVSQRSLSLTVADIFSCLHFRLFINIYSFCKALSFSTQGKIQSFEAEYIFHPAVIFYLFGHTETTSWGDAYETRWLESVTRSEDFVDLIFVWN